MSLLKNSMRIITISTAFLLLLGTPTNLSANVVTDAYSGAKKGVKKAKDTVVNVAKGNQRNLKYVVKLYGKVLKTEYELIKTVAKTPAYVATEIVTKKGQKPPTKSDLTITKMFLDKNCNVIVTIKNIGKGYTFLKHGTKTVDLFFKLNGKSWGGVTHKIFDPRKKLIRPGGSVTYKTNLKLKKSTKITAIIDNRNSVREANERNNTLTKNLSCAKPDLVIDKIYLNKDCRVYVSVKNIGKGTVDDSVWTKTHPKSASVFLGVDGKNWGGATIAGFDRRKRLQKAGGTALYRSKLIVKGTTLITARIDHTRQVRETNEKNNILNTKLTCNSVAKLKPAEKTMAKPTSKQNIVKSIKSKGFAKKQTENIPKAVLLKPDLVVEGLSLDSGCKIVVKLRNRGKGAIPDSLYNKIKLHISSNGNGWGSFSLAGLDRNKRTKNPNGVIIAKTSLKVNGSKDIGSTIDSTKVLKESNEDNNRYIQTLSCGN